MRKGRSTVLRPQGAKTTRGRAGATQYFGSIANKNTDVSCAAYLKKSNCLLFFWMRSRRSHVLTILNVKTGEPGQEALMSVSELVT